MRLNEFTIIEGRLVYLVPYEERHVKKYHKWMQSTELQTLTASEPLSLEQEFEMQKKWRMEDDIKYQSKCTFIVLCKSKYDETKDEIEAMVGDTNIFLKNKNIAEIEIMIAEERARGRGLGKEAVLLMLQYGILNLNVKTYRAIILKDNLRSISLFGSLGFEVVDENKIFNEIVLEKEVCDVWITWVKSVCKNYQECQLLQSSENLGRLDLKESL